MTLSIVLNAMLMKLTIILCSVIFSQMFVSDEPRREEEGRVEGEEQMIGECSDPREKMDM